VFVRDGAVVLADGGGEEVLLPLAQVPMTHGGRAGFQVENVLAAAAAAWGLGLAPETIRCGLSSFRADPEQAPARFKVLKAAEATVVVDYEGPPPVLAVDETGCRLAAPRQGGQGLADGGVVQAGQHPADAVVSQQGGEAGAGVAGVLVELPLEQGIEVGPVLGRQPTAFDEEVG
jgi:hypothetical protein